MVKHTAPSLFGFRKRARVIREAICGFLESNASFAVRVFFDCARGVSLSGGTEFDLSRYGLVAVKVRGHAYVCVTPQNQPVLFGR